MLKHGFDAVVTGVLVLLNHFHIGVEFGALLATSQQVILLEVRGVLIKQLLEVVLIGLKFCYLLL